MNPLIQGQDYIVYHFDGNNNDRDDISALPVAASLANAAGLEKKSFMFYNNNLSEKNNNAQVQDMRESAAFAEKLGIKTFDYQQNTNATTDKLVQIFNSGKKVLSIEGGPMEAVYRALEQTSPENLKKITLLSHSKWNENRDVINRPGIKEARTWSDLKKDFPQINYVDIGDQNGPGDSGFKSNKWSWLNNTNDPVFKEMRSRMKDSGYAVNDPSDAGMLFYAITGKEFGDPNDAKDYFAKNPPSFTNNNGGGSLPDNSSKPTPSSDNQVFLAKNGQVVIEAENTSIEGDWKPVTVGGRKSVVWDANDSNYGGVSEGQTLSYLFETDESGQYSIALNSGRDRSTMNSDESSRSDTGNDVYVSIIEQDTGKVIQNPVKLFTNLGNSDKKLNWGNTFDIDEKKSPAQVGLQANTQYRVEISGRSDGYVLDRITLSNDGVFKSTSAAQSQIKGDSPNPQPTPTPAPNPSPTPTPIPNPINSNIIEAEDMQLEGEYQVEKNGAASGGEVISLRGGNNNDTGTAKFAFQGDTNTYDIKVTYFDENDGVGQLKINQDGKELKSFKLDKDLGSPLANEQTKTFMEIKDVSVSKGDIFQIQGIEQGSPKTAEHARVDKIEFIPTNENGNNGGGKPPTNPKPPMNSTSMVIEAEDMKLSGEYRVEKINAASGGKVISLYGEDNNDTGGASFDFTGPTGNYKAIIHYFDENDGKGTLKVEKENQELISFKLDKELGSRFANEQTMASMEIPDISISSGDSFRIEGMEQGLPSTAEHARVDYIEFIPNQSNSAMV